MVEFDIKKSSIGFYYFPEELRKMMTDKVKVLPNNYAAIMYPDGTDLVDVVKSIERLLSELRDRVEKDK